MNINIEEVKKFWGNHPVAAAAVPHPLGSFEYFQYYDKLREENESLNFSYRLHEYKQFKGKKVLDVGCGNGYVLSKFAQEGADVTGVDITETGIDLCQKRFAFQELKGNFKVANAEELPFEDNTFDCVCSMGVLHHTPNTQQAVNEIYRVLKKEGKFIIMLYHKNSFAYQIRMRLEKYLYKTSLQQLVNQVDGMENPKGDVYSRKEMKKLLSNFKIQKIFAGSVRLQDIACYKNRPLLLKFLKLFEKKFGWFLYAKAIKH